MTRARNSANLASHGNLFVDITNDRTGIGSVVPAQNLHVAGTAGFHADVTFTGDLYNTTWDRSANTLRFNDSAQIKLGTGNDASFRHDGSNTWIQNTTGYLYIDAASSNGIRLISQSHWQAGAMAAFYPDGGVALYHDANHKFSTTAYGTNTVGTAVNDGLVVAGVATVTTMNVTGVLTYDDVTSVDSVGIVTARQGVHIDDSIVHIGDTDTKIRFPSANQISFESGGNEAFRVDSGRRLLHGVNTNTPVASTAGAQFQVHNNASVLTASFTGYGAHSGGSILALGKSRSNTIGDATGAVSNGDTLGDIRFGGSDGTDMHNTAAQILDSLGKVLGESVENINLNTPQLSIQVEPKKNS